MSVIRVNKTENYTVMSNYHLKDKNLSLKAVGLMSWMLSLPDNWDYSIAGITACRKREGKDAVRSALKELEDAGYLIRDTKRDANGRFSTEFTLIEEPVNREEKNRVGKSATENSPQINTKKTSTKKEESKKVECRRSYEDIINSLVEDPKVIEALQAYLQMRIMQKKAPSNNALILLVERLKELSQKPDEQVAIINQSTRGGYTDFYELKKQKASGGKSKTAKPKRDAIMKPIDYSGYWKNEDGTYDLSRYKDGRAVRTF